MEARLKLCIASLIRSLLLLGGCGNTQGMISWLVSIILRSVIIKIRDDHLIASEVQFMDGLIITMLIL